LINTSKMSENIFQKFRDKFFEEAVMLLDKFEKDILELEKMPDDRELLESVFRAMHTIKGISAMYGFEFISDFTHVLENIFQNMRDGKIKFSKEISEISLVSIDHIHNLLNDEKLINQVLKSKHNNLLAEVSRIASFKKVNNPDQPITPKPEGNSPHSWLIFIYTTEHMYFRGINLQGICRELSALGENKIMKVPALNTDDSDCWGILLVSNASHEDIRDVFMFIEDESRILHIKEGDLINTKSDSSLYSATLLQIAMNEPSILEIIERKEFKATNSEKALEVNENDIEKLNNLKHQSRRISVDTDKLDNLMYLVSQLITLNSQLSVSNRNRDYNKQKDQIEILDSLSKQFRTNALEIRLVPLSDISLRFQRLIRDLSKSMDKKIDYVTEGIDTELDKNTIDRIGEPLMHIIRRSHQ
jgi:two-component system chemotaxis sensor kinase CheA